MDEKELNNEENVKSSGRKRSTGAIIPVLAIITACCVLFSVMQTIFVLRLMSGQTGNMTYPVYCSLCRMIADHDLTRWMLRASRAVLINPAFIDHVKDDEVHMKDGTVNYISRYYKKDFRKTYNDQFLK